MDNRLIVKYAAESIKKYGPMASIVLSCCLREDFGIDVSSSKLAHIIKRYGKDKISRRTSIKESGFSSYGVNKETMIYELQVL
jgi:hypothetical protein